MKPYLLLKAPAELTIFYAGESVAYNSSLSGEVSCINMDTLVTTSIHAQVRLLRKARIKTTDQSVSDSTLKIPLKRFRSPSQMRWDEFADAEKILEHSVTIALQKSGKTSSDFQLQVPSYLPPTATISSVELSYAIIVTSTLPWGQSLHTGQILRISRRSIEPIPLQPTPIAYSHSPLAVQVSFEKPNPREHNVSATLCLKGLELSHSAGTLYLPSISGQELESTLIVLQEIRWQIEEKAILIAESPKGDRTLPMATATRSETVRTIEKGKHQPTWKHMILRPENEDHGFNMKIPFNIQVPKDIEFPSHNGLSLASDSLSTTVPSSRFLQGVPSHPDCNTRFSLYLEHNLRVCLHMAENTYQRPTMSLIHRKPTQYAYTTLLPLKGIEENSKCIASPAKYCISMKVL